MDHQFDAYSDSSTGTPRTPSPHEYLPMPYQPKDSYQPLPPKIDYQGNLLQELYDYDAPYSPDWQQQQPTHQPQVQSQPHTMVRRATFPYVRQDHPQHPQQYLPQPPYGDYHQIKQEDPNAFYRHSPYPHPQQLHHHQMAYPPPPIPQPYLSPHTGLPVQHTDDAASKETQYLRRRCFNCHTTEPPSWRRSTLNPGKIVCNKCGLYERTHLRPRPLRFDELRAGGKARKGSTGGGVQKMVQGGPMGSPTMPMTSPKIKKEPGLHRRSSVSSNASTGTGTANSDWDDNVSIYSTSSTPSSFSSPSLSSSFPLPMPSPPASASLPLDSGIRVPNNPLAELHSQHSHPSLYQAYQAGESVTVNGAGKSHSLPLGGMSNGAPNGATNPYPPSVPEMAEWTSAPPSQTHSPSSSHSPVQHSASPPSME